MSYPNEVPTPAPPSPSMSLSSPSSKQALRLNAQSPTFIPRFASPLSQTTFEESLSGKASGTETPPTVPPSDTDSTDDDLSATYVKLKLKISDIEDRKASGQHDAAFLDKLQKRLKQIQSDYLFDKRDAEAAYVRERQKVYSRRLEARLRGERPPSPARKQPPDNPPSPSPQPSPEPTSSSKDVFDQVSDDETSGGLFELLEQMPETEITPQGTTVRVRDLPMPKQWSGKTPRHMLQEAVHKLDRYAIVEYRLISGQSRAKRAAVQVRWSKSGDKASEWAMEDVACHDEAQAKLYIATVALHSLTFPPIPGFALGSTAAASNVTFFRLLPPVFRDLWAELEEKRKETDDATNREIWSKLKSLLEPKLSDYKVRCNSSCVPVSSPQYGSESHEDQ